LFCLQRFDTDVWVVERTAGRYKKTFFTNRRGPFQEQLKEEDPGMADPDSPGKTHLETEPGNGR